MSHYSASWASPLGGLHPTLQLHIDAVPTPSCALYTHISLPPHFIADKFQLVQLHREGKLGAYDASIGGRDSFGHAGEAGLEAPVWKAGEGSLLIRVREAEVGAGPPKRIHFEVPLHLRYQAPVKERHTDGLRQDVVEVEFPYPRVFWACPDGASSFGLPTAAELTAYHRRIGTQLTSMPASIPRPGFPSPPCFNSPLSASQRFDSGSTGLSSTLTTFPQPHSAYRCPSRSSRRRNDYGGDNLALLRFPGVDCGFDVAKESERSSRRAEETAIRHDDAKLQRFAKRTRRYQPDNKRTSEERSESVYARGKERDQVTRLCTWLCGA